MKRLLKLIAVLLIVTMAVPAVALAKAQTSAWTQRR